MKVALDSLDNKSNQSLSIAGSLLAIELGLGTEISV